MQEQLTCGFVQLALDIETIISSAGQQLFKTSALNYKFSFSAGRTVGQFPNCTNPRTLAAMFNDLE